MALRRSLAIAVLCLGACATEPQPQPESPAATPAAKAAPPAIDKVALEPKELKLDQSGTATLGFELGRPARVTVEMQDESGNTVRRFDLGDKSAGPVEVAWDGRDGAGKPVPSGVYLYRISAIGPDGAAIVAVPEVQGGGEVLAQRFTLDRETGTMRFLLPQPSRVRLRVGLKGYPLLRTIYDWTPLLAGPHEITWDGRDSTGLIELSKRANLDVNLTAFALPGNAVLVTGSGPLEHRPSGKPAEMPAGAFFHALHATEICREPRLRVEFVGAKGKSRNGLPLVSGVTPVRVTLDPADAVHLVNTRFEVMLFIDTVFLTESEEGSNPYTYSLDTRALTPGPHLFTVNVLGYDDHFGTQTVQFERGAGR